MLHTKRHAVIINSIKKQLSRDYSAYIALVLFVSALLVIFLKLWEKDLRIPFSYMIDAFGPLKEVKNAVLGNGLYSRFIILTAESRWKYRSAAPIKGKEDYDTFFKKLSGEVLDMFLFLQQSPTEVILSDSQ